jgi:hypothetical protein
MKIGIKHCFDREKVPKTHLHADAEQIAKLDLGDVVRDILIVHQIRVGDICGTRWR